MSGSVDRKSPHEIVIVRRRNGGHGDGHQGGAWKIAFADFMTALMCFFLVMWLINSTDKKTIVQIATYFNPLHLNDRAVSRKAVNDDKGSSEAEEGAAKPEKSKQKKASAKGSQKSEASDAKAKPAGAGDTSVANDGPTDAELQQDPLGSLARIAAGDSLPLFPEMRSPIGRSDAILQTEPRQSPAIPDGKASAGNSADAGRKAPATRLADAIGQQVREELREWTIAPTVEVVTRGEAVLIRLSDGRDRPMFQSASARPTRELVLALEKIGEILTKIPGRIIIEGHTDGRPFRKTDNDNWRLSIARAQAAFYMLQRGGLGEDRVWRIEGHADKMPRSGSNALAAENRRIEILVDRNKP